MLLYASSLPSEIPSHSMLSSVNNKFCGSLAFAVGSPSLEAAAGVTLACAGSSAYFLFCKDFLK